MTSCRYSGNILKTMEILPLSGLAYSDTRDTFPRLLSEITRNSERITRIVQNLKHMARQDTGRLAENVDVQQVLEATLMIIAQPDSEIHRCVQFEGA